VAGVGEVGGGEGGADHPPNYTCWRVASGKWPLRYTTRS
jgi:hypothetical protein